MTTTFEKLAETDGLSSEESASPITLKQQNAQQKLKHLQRIFESIMWEFMTVKEGRWEDLSVHTQRKKELINQMKEYDWTPSPSDRENLEIEIFKAQIVDLEYQTRKMLESNMNVIQTLMSDLQKRQKNLRSAVAPYLKAMDSYSAPGENLNSTASA